MDRLYLHAAGCLLCEYDSFLAITYSWLGIGRIQEVIINVSQWEVFALTEGVVEHNVSYTPNNNWEDVSVLSKNWRQCFLHHSNGSSNLVSCRSHLGVSIIQRLRVIFQTIAARTRPQLHLETRAQLQRPPQHLDLHHHILNVLTTTMMQNIGINHLFGCINDDK